MFGLHKWEMSFYHCSGGYLSDSGTLGGRMGGLCFREPLDWGGNAIAA